MHLSLRPLAAAASLLAISFSPGTARASDPAPPPPAATVTPVPAPPKPAQADPPPKPDAAAPAEKPEARKGKQDREKPAKRQKDKKEDKESSGFDPKSFLLKLVFAADADGDGALSVEEFRGVPLLKELKKERVDSLFAEIDADTNASLSAEEVGKGFGKITSLAKESRSQLNDADAAKQAKKLKRLAK